MSKKDATTEPYGIGSGAVTKRKRTDQAGRFADTAVTSLAMSLTCSETTVGSDREDLDSRIHRATSSRSWPNDSEEQALWAAWYPCFPSLIQLGLGLSLWPR